MWQQANIYILGHLRGSPFKSNKYSELYFKETKPNKTFNNL